MNNKHIEYLDAAKQRIIDSNILSEDIFDFYKTLFKYQEMYFEIFTAYSAEVDYINLEKFPIVDIEKINFLEKDKIHLYDGLHSLIKIIEKSHKGIQLEKIYQEFKNRESLFKESIKYLLQHNLDELEKISESLKIGLEEYIFVTVNLFKPYFINLQYKYMKDVDLSDWDKSVCPFCGYYPDMSKIIESKDNKRILHCGFCEYEWQYKRVSCTICENSDQDKLSYFTYDDNMFRIDCCDNCKGYLKTIRIPKQLDESRYDLTVENIITNYLDSSAIEMGYGRP